MDCKFGRLAEYTLLNMMEGTLTDVMVYEFVEECCKCMMNETGVQWESSVKELWDYLTVGRTALDEEGINVKDAFRQGRVYAAMECLKISMEKHQGEYDTEKDAKKYLNHWYNVFLALEDGRSLTHKELADACRVSESSLAQFLHKIEHKKYIHFRKAGRNKYYRLTQRGQVLLKYMNAERNCDPCQAYSISSLGRSFNTKRASKYHDITDVHNASISENCYLQRTIDKKLSDKLTEGSKKNRYESFIVKS